MGISCNLLLMILSFEFNLKIIYLLYLECHARYDNASYYHCYVLTFFGNVLNFLALLELMKPNLVSWFSCQRAPVYFRHLRFLAADPLSKHSLERKVISRYIYIFLSNCFYGNISIKANFVIQFKLLLAFSFDQKDPLSKYSLKCEVISGCTSFLISVRLCVQVGAKIMHDFPIQI